MNINPLFTDYSEERIEKRQRIHFSFIIIFLILFSFIIPPVNASDYGDEPGLEQGLSYYNDKDYLSAITPLKSCVNKNPNAFNCWFYLGNSYYNLGQYDDAKSAFLKATEIGPKEDLPKHNLGLTYEKLGDMDQSKYWNDQYNSTRTSSNIYGIFLIVMLGGILYIFTRK